MLDTQLTSFIARDNTQDEDSANPYGYTPTFAVCVLFLTLFGITTFIHLCQAFMYRKWFFLYTAVFAGFIELAGWSGRLWSSQNVDNSDAFTIQIICTIVAPTPLLAANFIILSRIIRKLGESYSRLSPRRYSRIFVSCDVIALFVQAGGGSVSSGNNIPQSQVKIGSYIILGGIGFQLFVIICYMTLATEYFWRFTQQRPVHRTRICATAERTVIVSPRLRLLIHAMVFNTGCLLIRAIYRTVELSFGFNGKVTRTQWLFDVFDATMIVLAMLTWNLYHPGRLLGKDDDSYTDQPETESPFMELNPTNTSTV